MVINQPNLTYLSSYQTVYLPPAHLPTSLSIRQFTYTIILVLTSLPLPLYIGFFPSRRTHITRFPLIPSWPTSPIHLSPSRSLCGGASAATVTPSHQRYWRGPPLSRRQHHLHVSPENGDGKRDSEPDSHLLPGHLRRVWLLVFTLSAQPLRWWVNGMCFVYFFCLFLSSYFGVPFLSYSHFFLFYYSIFFCLFLLDLLLFLPSLSFLHFILYLFSFLLSFLTFSVSLYASAMAR